MTFQPCARLKSILKGKLNREKRGVEGHFSRAHG